MKRYALSLVIGLALSACGPAEEASTAATVAVRALDGDYAGAAKSSASADADKDGVAGLYRDNGITPRPGGAGSTAAIYAGALYNGGGYNTGGNRE